MLIAFVVATMAAWFASEVTAAERDLRAATYNSSLFRDQDGQLVQDLAGGQNEQAKKIAEVIQRVRPDVMLVNEFDYDAAGKAADSFIKEYLAVGQNGCEPIQFAHHFTAPVNTGKPSGRDLDHNGRPGDPADAIGYGKHEGEYGMLVLSKFPIDKEHVRTYQNFLWRNMPGAMVPKDPKTGQPFFNDEDMAVQCLSSKSMWDVPINVQSDGGKNFVLHLLCSHPTPPVFDGPEDRNGCRNHDEIRLLADYIGGEKGEYLIDDKDIAGGLANDAMFVIVGDLNCDPVDGDSVPGTMDQLLKHPRVNSEFTPSSAGSKLATEQKSDPKAIGRGDPAQDTSNFGDFKNLRIDYVLPSKGFKILDGGIFWPVPGEPGREAIEATDHRSVWLDVKKD